MCQGPGAGGRAIHFLQKPRAQEWQWWEEEEARAGKVSDFAGLRVWFLF